MVNTMVVTLESNLLNSLRLFTCCSIPLSFRFILKRKYVPNIARIVKTIITKISIPIT